MEVEQMIEEIDWGSYSHKHNYSWKAINPTTVNRKMIMQLIIICTLVKLRYNMIMNEFMHSTINEMQGDDKGGEESGDDNVKECYVTSNGWK